MTMKANGGIQFLERQFRAGAITRYEFEYLKRIRTEDPRVRIEEEARLFDERAEDNDGRIYG